MTNAQKWVVIFFAMFIVLLFISFATSDNEETNTDKQTTETNASAEVSGMDIYTSAGCASCHGKNMEGTKDGPSLAKISERWTKTELVTFLRNPDDFSKDKRILKSKKNFPNSFMPSFNSIDAKKLGRLAELLLSK
jgi:cbb3-type cytochrome oxidase cytochrome c subunit